MGKGSKMIQASPSATIQLDLRYDEMNEATDSLRKDVVILPFISIT
jgi:hypothetical protein